jgi:shikimate dehydrogenase
MSLEARGRGDWPSPGILRYLPDGTTRLLGIVGRPLDHSLSPALHTAALRALDRNLIYLPFPVSEDRLEDLLRLAPEIGLLGLNVTTPYKERVARLVAAADDETRKTGMVNTVRIAPQGAVGFGTDGEGILRWIEEIGLPQAPLGVLGFGPAARSLVCRAAARGWPIGAIVTRRAEPVRAAIASWGAPAIPILEWGTLPSAETRPPAPSVWVSCLPPSAAPLPRSFWAWNGRGAIALDLNYGEGRTAIRDEARAHGIRSADGLGPLCQQAALSLSAWLGEEVPVGLFHGALARPASTLRPE